MPRPSGKPLVHELTHLAVFLDGGEDAHHGRLFTAEMARLACLGAAGAARWIARAASHR